MTIKYVCSEPNCNHPAYLLEYPADENGNVKKIALCEKHGPIFGFCLGCGYYLAGTTEWENPWAKQTGYCLSCLQIEDEEIQDEDEVFDIWD